MGLTEIMKVKVKLLSRVRLFAIPWTPLYQAPLSIEFSRQEYWSGLPPPNSGDLPNPGVELTSPAVAGNSLSSEPPGKPVTAILIQQQTQQIRRLWRLCQLTR